MTSSVTSLARRVARNVMVMSDRSVPKSFAWQILNFENRTIISRDTAIFVKPCQTEEKKNTGTISIIQFALEILGGSTKRIKHLRRGRSIILEFEKCLCVCPLTPRPFIDMQRMMIGFHGNKPAVNIIYHQFVWVRVRKGTPLARR